MTAPVCSIAPIAPAATAALGSRPKINALPASGGSRPSIMSIVVDLPAPFGPSRATVWPRGIETSMLRTASTAPRGVRNDFVRPLRPMLSVAATAGKRSRPVSPSASPAAPYAGRVLQDRARIYVQAGAGGNGSVSFRREAHVPRGGPDGGDGGRGADVLVVCDGSLRDLQVFRRRGHWKAARGGHGEGSNRHGASPAALEVRV